MNIQYITVALEHAREQLLQAKKKLDATTESELIDAAIYEQKAWEERCRFFQKKIKEAAQSGQAIPCQRYVQFGGRR